MIELSDSSSSELSVVISFLRQGAEIESIELNRLSNFLGPASDLASLLRLFVTAKELGIMANIAMDLSKLVRAIFTERRMRPGLCRGREEACLHCKELQSNQKT